MNFAPKHLLRNSAKIKTTILFLSVVFFFASLPAEIFAQKTFSKTYPATKSVKLELTNREGTVTVIGWNRELVEIKANLEAPAATIIPQNLSGKIVINVVKDNADRRQVGSCNFTVKVPYSSSVDIETIMGNLTVSDVRGMQVRAHISTEGDITLTNIFVPKVWAQNTMGDILFDGEIQQGGTYNFQSMRGNINLRIPFNSSFRLVATAPSTRNISLGGLSNAELNYVSDGRRVVGRVNGGSASLTVTNHRGGISFYNR